MNQQLMLLVAFLGGIFLAVQAGFNAKLGMLLKNPSLAAISTSISSVLLASAFVLIYSKEIPGIHIIKQIPWYLWFTGGLFSIMGITLYYYTIPKLGMSTTVSLGLCGQLLYSVVAAHFGWFNLPIQPINIKKIIGVVAMALGILFINIK